MSTSVYQVTLWLSVNHLNRCLCSHCSKCLLVSTNLNLNLNHCLLCSALLCPALPCPSLLCSEIKSLSHSLTDWVTRSPIELSWTAKNKFNHRRKWPQKPPQAGCYFFSKEKDLYRQTSPKDSGNRIRQRFIQITKGVQLKFTNVAGFGNLTSFPHKVDKFHTISKY